METVGDRKIKEVKNLGPLEEKMFRYLALEDEEMRLAKMLQRVQDKKEELKKDSHLMTAVGQLKRLQGKAIKSNTFHDSSEEEEKLTKKRKLKANASTSVNRLSQKMKNLENRQSLKSEKKSEAVKAAKDAK